ncbi:MAG: cytochrome c [Alphaproteobacteria bacterium]|nr:cytochrome c [Alphaproteobacteria bacterium]
MSSWLKRAALAAAAVTLVGAVGLEASMAQGDPIAQRKALMKSNGDAMKAIKAVVDAKGPTAPVVPEAAKIASNLKSAAAHFPAGSDTGDTKASPDIWKNLDEFKKLDESSTAAAMKLEASAKKGDAAVVAADFGELGKSCGACHQKYRLK